jgi:hypothetical protein
MKRLCSLIAAVLIMPICYGQLSIGLSYTLVNTQAAGGIGSIASDTSGNIIFTGSFSSTITFGSFTLTNNDPTAYNEGNDAYIAKRLVNGNIAWAKAIKLTPIIGADSRVSIYDVETDPAGNSYITGYYLGKISLDNINLSSAKNGPDHTWDMFTAKLSPAGVCTWAKSEGGNEKHFNELGRALTVDGQGNVYATGRAVYKVYKNTNVCTTGNPNIIADNTVIPSVYLVKYSPSGTKIWEKKFYNSQANANTCNSTEMGFNIMAEGTNIYVTGHVRGIVSFGAFTLNTGSNNTQRGFIAKLDGSGNVLWAKMAGGGTYNMVYAVGDGLFSAPGGDVYMSGIFYDTLVFGGVTITTPTASGYLAKFSPAGVCQWGVRLGNICYGLADLSNGNLAMLARFGNAPSPGYGLKEISPSTGATVDSVIATVNATPPSISHWSGLARTPDGFVYSEMLGGDYNLGSLNVASVGSNDMVLIRYGSPGPLPRMYPGGPDTRLMSADIILYPNPAHDHLTIENRSNESLGQLKIYDASGRLIYKEFISNAKAFIDIKDYSTGVYYLRNGRSAPLKFTKH